MRVQTHANYRTGERPSWWVDSSYAVHLDMKAILELQDPRKSSNLHGIHKTETE